MAWRGWALAVIACASSYPSRCSALRVSFDVATSDRLIPVEHFSTSGGVVRATLSILPTGCSNNGTDCWSYLSQTYLALFDKQHLLNLTKWLSAENFPLDATARSAASCTQPALGWQSLSLPSWQGALATTPGGVHRRFMDASLLESVHDKIRFPPPSGTPITFQTDFRFPMMFDQYTLAIFNCFGHELHVFGEATFAGRKGQTLTAIQQDVLTVRMWLAGISLACALCFGLFCLAYRHTAVPVQALLVIVFFLFFLQHAFLTIPLIAASQGTISPAGALLASLPLESYAALNERDQGGSFTSTSGGGDRAFSEGGGTAPSPPIAVPTNMTWGLQRWAIFASSALQLLASLGFITALIAIAAGRHFLRPASLAREQEALAVGYILYFTFGMLQQGCSGQVLCGIFVLSYQVIRILFIFAILLLLNSASDSLRRTTGHNWPTMRVDLLRLMAFREIRLRLLLVYLVLPIAFLFIEVVLDWRYVWFRLFWREAVEIYMVFTVAWRLLPTPNTYSVHFAILRHAPDADVARGLYPRFFRFLLGSTVNAARADAAVATQHARSQAAAHQYRAAARLSGHGRRQVGHSDAHPRTVPF